MPPLSVAIVCKDNLATIGRTLDSVRGLADQLEILAVDSGSTDGTLDLLARHHARVIRSPWLGHVKTKQLALESCTGDWVLSLDSDESLLPPLHASIRAALARNDPAVVGYEVNRKVFYRDRPLNHTWQPEWRLRLVRRGAAAWGGLDPHDVLAPLARGVGSGGGSGGGGVGGVGRVERLAGDLRHDSISTFAEFLRKQAGHAALMARSLHQSGERGSRARVLISPAGAFVKQFIIKGGWRDGLPGWLAAGSTAAGTLIKHLALLELSAPSPAGPNQAASPAPRAAPNPPDSPPIP
jgi:hypothetical protein